MSVYSSKEYKDSIKRTVSYEWRVEQTNTDTDDIEDSYEIDLTELSSVDPLECCDVILTLRRMAGTDANGMDEQGYAYVIGGELEKAFCSGHKVPKRYIEMIRATNPIGA